MKSWSRSGGVSTRPSISRFSEWSAKKAALDALAVGTTTIIDHNESPNAIEGSLSVLAAACAEVGVRLVASYGVSDRHGEDNARRGLEENRRFLTEGGRGMVGVHAAFTCSDRTLEEAAALAEEFGVGVHIHLCEGPEDLEAPARVSALSRPSWLLAHCVHLATAHSVQGTIVHNPASNLNNAVGYAQPSRFTNPVALGTDGIGADMISGFQLAYFLERSADPTASPERAWSWLEEGWKLVPEARTDRVSWNDESMDPFSLAFSAAPRPLRVEVAGEVVWDDGEPTKVDATEIRAKAAEQARRLHSLL